LVATAELESSITSELQKHGNANQPEPKNDENMEDVEMDGYETYSEEDISDDEAQIHQKAKGKKK
jgi:hypothetical protein